MASSATSVLPEPTSPCSSRSIRRWRGEVGVDLGQRRRLRGRERMAERGQRLRPQRSVAGQRPPGPGQHAPAHQRQRHLPGQQLVIGEAAPRCARPARVLRRVHGAQRRGESRPLLAPQQRRVVPFRESRGAGRAPRRAGGAGAGEQAGGQRPDRLDSGSRSAASSGTIWSGWTKLRRSVDLADTSSFARRPAVCVAGNP